MTDSLLAPGREVLYKRYHTGELVEATILGPSVEGDDFIRVKYTRNGRVVVKINGRAKNYITAYLHFAITISVGVNQEGDEVVIFGDVVRLKPVLIWKGGTNSIIKKELLALKRELEASIALCFEWARCFLPRDVLLPFFFLRGAVTPSMRPNHGQSVHGEPKSRKGQSIIHLTLTPQVRPGAITIQYNTCWNRGSKETSSETGV